MRKINRLIRNENGSITMFVILSVLFLIFVLVGIYANYANKLKAQEDRIEKIQDNYGEYASEEEMDKLYATLTPELPVGEGTTPWMPDGFSKVIGTNLDNGLVISNSSGTQNYVWIEVPTTISASVTRDGVATEVKLADATSNEEISAILEAYAGDYTEGSNTQTNDWEDEWYDSSGNTETSSTNLEDATACGLTNYEYKIAYNNMLKSIQKYGGFWLAQYEAGIAYEEDEAKATNRTSGSSRITTFSSANYAKNQYPYNYVTCSEAQQIAAKDSKNGEYTSSLPFGIQWDLVCKFLDVKTNLEYADIATTSKWGNYEDTLWASNANSKYSEDYSESYLAGAKTKSGDGEILLTTGAIEATTLSTDASPMNIYDFAGNVWEWTLECGFDSNYPCGNRGGSYKVLR